MPWLRSEKSVQRRGRDVDCRLKKELGQWNRENDMVKQKHISMLNFECLKFLTHETYVIRHMASLGSLYTVQVDLKLTAESLWRIPILI